ncbi:5992_t:CDS:1, partial [Funneliformis caledonium]
SGLDLAVAEDRDIIFEALTKLCEYFLSFDSFTTTFTKASSSTTNATAPAEQSS